MTGTLLKKRSHARIESEGVKRLAADASPRRAMRHGRTRHRKKRASLRDPVRRPRRTCGDLVVARPFGAHRKGQDQRSRSADAAWLSLIKQGGDPRDTDLKVADPRRIRHQERKRECGRGHRTPLWFLDGISNRYPLQKGWSCPRRTTPFSGGRTLHRPCSRPALSCSLLAPLVY